MLALSLRNHLASWRVILFICLGPRGGSGRERALQVLAKMKSWVRDRSGSAWWMALNAINQVCFAQRRKDAKDNGARALALPLKLSVFARDLLHF